MPGLKASYYCPSHNTTKLGVGRDVMSAALQKYRSDKYNTNKNLMDHTVDGDVVVLRTRVFLKKYSKLNSYNEGRTGMLSVVDNNHLIMRALATAFKYRDIYERGHTIPQIARDEKVSETTVRRYVKLAYINPQKINEILDARTPFNVDELFNIPPMF